METRELRVLKKNLPPSALPGRTMKCSLLCVLGLPSGLHLVGHAWNSSPWRCPGGILSQMPELVPFTVAGLLRAPPRLTELLTPSQESTDASQRTFISFVCAVSFLQSLPRAISEGRTLVVCIAPVNTELSVYSNDHIFLVTTFSSDVFCWVKLSSLRILPVNTSFMRGSSLSAKCLVLNVRLCA